MITTAAPKTLTPNRQVYQRLKQSFELGLRRQIFVAVCDDLALRDRLAARLHAELTTPDAKLMSSDGGAVTKPHPRLVSLHLNLSDPNPMAQISQWLVQHPSQREGGHSVSPGFQVLGVERLTRQPAAVQRLFLSYLQGIERSLPSLESSLLLWVSRPWLCSIQQSAPEFWAWHTGVFEFVGEPTPAGVDRQPLILIPEPIAYTQNPTIVAPVSHSNQPPLDEVHLWDILQEDLAQLDQPLPTVPSRELPDPLPDSETPDAPAQEGQATTTLSTTPATITAQDVPQANKVLSESLADNGDFHPPNPNQPELGAVLQPATQEEMDALINQLLADVQRHESADKVAVTVRQQAANPASDLVYQREGEAKTVLTIEADAVPVLTDHTAQPQVRKSLLHRVLEETSDSQPFQILRYIEQLHEQNAPPANLAAAYRTLGNFYRDRIEQGDQSAQTLQVAIQVYEQTLEWLRAEELTAQEQGQAAIVLKTPNSTWSEVLNDVGNLYWMLARTANTSEQQQAHLEHGIRLYHQAIKRANPTEQPQAYAMIQNNLGAAYGDMARYGDPAQHLQQSVVAYQEAIRYRSKEAELQRWAATQNNLGTAYWHLAQYQQPAIYLRQAIAAYSEALQAYHPSTEALTYAMIQNNLGTAYWNLSQYEQPVELLMLAIESYQAALRYRTAEALPAGHAATHNNLGTAYWHLANYLKEDPNKSLQCLQEAIVAYTIALNTAEKLPPALLSFDLFATHNNLGLAQHELATAKPITLDQIARRTYLENALKNHLQALQGWHDRPDFYDAALSYIIQDIKSFYGEFGLSGQNLALSKVPGSLLPQILPRL